MFINVCYHETIDKPGQKKKLDDKGNEVDGLNVPLSVGPIRTSPDRAGNLCLAVDAVVNPSVNVDIMHDRSGSHRDFVCLLLIQCVEQKYFEKNGNLDRKYRLPQLRYFGYVDKKTGMVVPRASENERLQIILQLTVLIYQILCIGHAPQNHLSYLYLFSSIQIFQMVW